jgi:hypothetical protein
MKNLSFNQWMLILALCGCAAPTGGMPFAIVAIALVANECFRNWKEIKHKEADIASFEEAFAKYKRDFDMKVSSLDSRVSTFVAMRSMNK